MHPVGPLNSKVYWIRRVGIVVLAVAVLIGAVWFLASRSSRSSAGQQLTAATGAVSESTYPTLTGVLSASAAPSTAPPTTAPPTTGPPTTAAPSKPAPTKGAPAKAAPTKAAPTKAAPTKAAPKPPPAQAPSYAEDGALLCPDTAVAVAAISTAPSFEVGSQPTVGMTVTNTGVVPCRRDVSGTLQTFTVQAANGKRVWSTTDCFPGAGTEVRDLAPGQTLRYTVKWSGTTSAPGCAGDRAPVAAGKYVIIAQLGKLSSQPAAFTVTR